MALWTPAEITTDLWLDASDASTITIDTGVSNWSDKSGNGNDAVQATGASQPSVNAASLNSLDTILFSQDELKIPAFPTLPKFTVFIVYKYITTPIAYPIPLMSGAVNTWWSVVNYVSTSERYWRKGNSAPDAVQSTLPTGVFEVVSLTAGGGTNLHQQFSNGTLTASATASDFATTSQALSIGNAVTQAGNYANMDVAEILIVAGNDNTNTRQKIEGYLAHKWGLEANLPSGHPYELAAPTVFDPSTIPVSQKIQLTCDSTPISADQTDFPLTVVLDGTDPLHSGFLTAGSFDPSQITTSLWLDASDASTITIDTGVSNWADKSGNSNDAVQASGSAQPTVVGANLNGLDTLRFNGSNQYLSHPVISITPTDLHIFAVSKFTGTVSGVLWSHRYESTRLIQATWQSATEVLLQLRSNASGLISVSKTVTSGNWINENLKFSMTDVSHNVWVDGESSTANTTSFAGQNFGSNNETIGAAFSPSVSSFFEGDLAEIIIINDVVSETDRQKIEGYLAWKWGLEANLPSGHPYELISPLGAPPHKKFSIEAGGVQCPVELESWEGFITPTQHWTMDDVSGSTLNNEISGGVTGTINNMTQTASGKFDQYLAGGSITGTIRNIDLGVGVSFKSLSFWIKRVDNTTYCRALDLDNICSMTIGTSSDGGGHANEVYWYDGTTLGYTGLFVSDTNWHHIAIVEGSTNGNHYTYVDGAKSSSEISTDLGGIIRYLGRSATQGSSHVPSFDNVQLFDEVLTDSQVQELFNATSQLKYPGGHATLHTKVPTYTAASDPELVLSYDNSQVDNTGYVGDTGDTPAQSVWDSNFVAVYHMAQDPSGTAPQILDSTSNANHGSSEGVMTSADLVDGLFGKALEFDGVDDGINIGAILTNETQYTFSAQVMPTALPNEGFIVTFGDHTYNVSRTMLMTRSTGEIQWYMQDPSNGITVAPTNVFSINNWITLSGVRDGTTSILYADGANIGQDSNASIGDSIDDSGYIGKNQGADGFFTGQIGEVRISNIARSADWIKLTNLSLTDQLITFTAYSTGGGAILNYIDLAYSMYPTEPMQGYTDLLYAINQDLLNYIDFIYGLRLTAYEDLPYSDNPLLRAFVNMPYGDRKQLIRAIDLLYGDTPKVTSYLDLRYTIYKSLLNYMDMPYGISLKRLKAYEDLSYDIQVRTQLRKFTDLVYGIMSDNKVKTMSLQLYLDGVKIKHTLFSYEYSFDQYCIQAEVHTADQSVYLAIEEYVSELRSVEHDGEHLFIAEKPRRMRKPGATVYVLPFVSKSVALERADTITKEYPAGMASEIVASVASEVGISVSWEVIDWFLPSGSLIANDETPLQIIRKVASAIKAKVQSDRDGNIRIIRLNKYNNNEIEYATPDFYFDDGDFSSTGDNPDPRLGYNKFLVSDHTVPSKNSWIDTEDVTSFNKIVKGFKVPFDTTILTLEHSGGEWVSKDANGLSIESIKEELVEIVDGKGSAKYPIYGLLGSPVYKQVNLGTITYSEDGTITTQTLGQTLVEISYITQYYSWNVTDYSAEKVQFYIPDEEA